MNKRKFFSVLWSCIAFFLCVWSAWLFFEKGFSPDTDILALLPEEKQGTAVQQISAKITSSAERQVLVLVGAHEWADTVVAAKAYLSVIDSNKDVISLHVSDTGVIQKDLFSVFSDHATRLLSAEQHQRLLTESSDFWTGIALDRLYGFGGPHFLSWVKDPFGLFDSWVLERLQETAVRPKEGFLSVSDHDMQYAVLPLVIQGEGTAFSQKVQEDTLSVLLKAEQNALKAFPNAKILSGGIVLHAAVAGSNAASEISIIGTGSLIGIVILVCVAFRSVRPLLMVVLSLAVGIIGAFAVCSMIFGKIHILTIVFGTTLTGVAQDYGTYFLCRRYCCDSKTDSISLAQILLPSMALTLITTVIGYLGMMIAPFPGLRQMALFAIFGLIFTWLSVFCWFPYLMPFATKKNLGWQFYQRVIHNWPTAGKNGFTLILFACLVPVVSFGILHLRVDDSISTLQKTDEKLLEMQKKISSLMDIPHMAQFFIVTGKDEQQFLEHEELLKEKLQLLVEKNIIRGYQMQSDWIPSIKKQKENEQLVYEKLAPAAQFVTATTGVPLKMDMSRKTYLLPDMFSTDVSGKIMEYIRLVKTKGGVAGGVFVRGVSYADVPKLKALEDPDNGIVWFDKVNDISTVLGKYRVFMELGCIGAYLLIGVLLFFRYHKQFWRVLLPPLLSSLVVLAMLGMCGMSLNLFSTLSFLLILGIGVDSGIFMLEQRGKNFEEIWLEIGLSSASTILSFGLLSFSNMPMLRAFGFPMLVGIACVWILVPCFRVVNEDQ